MFPAGVNNARSPVYHFSSSARDYMNKAIPIKMYKQGKRFYGFLFGKMDFGRIEYVSLAGFVIAARLNGSNISANWLFGKDVNNII